MTADAATDRLLEAIADLTAQLNKLSPDSLRQLYEAAANLAADARYEMHLRGLDGRTCAN